MRIADCFGRGRPVISFEFFPPKTDAGFQQLFRTIADLRDVEPSWVSVTWGAGGSTRARTIETVERIQREAGLTAMAHLTCVGSTREELIGILDHLRAAGVENLLALGGDPPRDQPEYRPPPGGLTFASELVALARAHAPMCIAAACYPETHPRARSAEEDVAHLAHKVAAGVDFLVTQLFFDVEDYVRFVARARAAGIRVPIVPGIMPVTSQQNVRRMATLCGARIPLALDAALKEAGDDAERTLEAGIAWATAQCRALLDAGAPGLHFFTLNHSPATRRIHAALFGS